MKKLLLSTLALALGVSATAQTHFSQTTGTIEAFSNSGFGSVKLSSGNFVTVQPNSYYGFTIRQYNTYGTLLLTTQLSNSICDIHTVTSVNTLDENSILVTGYGGTGYDSYIAKINLATNNITINTLSVMGGYTNGPKASTNGSDIFVSYPSYSAFTLSKLDANLNPVWTKTCEADTVTGKNPSTDCELVDDSTIVIIGKCDDEIGWGDYDTSGYLDSFRLYHAPGYIRLYDISKTADGNVLLSGLHSHTYAGASSPFIAKLTKSGSVIWAKVYDDANPGLVFSTFLDAIELPNGNIAAFGSYMTFLTSDGVCLLDANGNLLSAKHFGNTEFSYSINDYKVYNDGILLTGILSNNSNSTLENLMIFSDFNFDVVCHKTDVTLTTSAFTMGTTTSVNTSGVRENTIANGITYNYGTVTLGTGVGVNVCATVTEVNEVALIESSVYPNPVEAGSNLNITLSEAGAYDISVIDFNGKVISQFHANGNTALVNTSGFASGNYLVRVTNNGQTVATEKLLVK